MCWLSPAHFRGFMLNYLKEFFLIALQTALISSTILGPVVWYIATNRGIY